MKLLIVLMVLFLIWGVAESATVLGIFTSGQTFDAMPDGSYLQFDGTTKDGTLLITRRMYDNVLNYFPVPMGITIKPFSWYILDVRYTFAMTSDGRLTISK